MQELSVENSKTVELESPDFMQEKAGDFLVRQIPHGLPWSVTLM
jgi:hypothetical protein